MPEIPVISAKHFLKTLLLIGCEEVSIKGSHHKVRNILNGKITVVPVHSNVDLKKGLFSKILKQLDIDIEEFIKVLSR